MAKYHIKRDGTPAICHAGKGKCPLGGADNHFSTQEAAQQAADERNANNYLKIDTKPSFEFHKISPLSTLFTGQNAKNGVAQLDRLEKKRTSLINKFTNKCHRIKVAKKREKAIHAFKSTDLEYQRTTSKINNTYVTLQERAEQREQAAKAVKDLHEHIDNVSFSNVSASTYIRDKAGHAKQIISYFENHGYTVKVNPDFVDTGQKIGIRLADHEPADYYKHNEHDMNKVFDYTDVDVLVTFKSVQTNKKLPRKVFDAKINQLNQISNSIDKLFKNNNKKH